MESLRRKLLTNPREKANFASVLIFWWTIGIFRTGYRKVFELEDLIEPLTNDRSKLLGNRLEDCWLRKRTRSVHPSLVATVIQTFWREYAALGLISVFNDVFIRLSQPLLLGQLLMYFRQDEPISHTAAVLCAVGITCMSVMGALVSNQYTHASHHNGMKVRIAVCSLIYRKALRLSQAALGQTAAGQMINLLSNDVNRFDFVSVFVHSMWTAPLMAVVVAYLLYVEVGWAGLIGIAIVFVVVPIQSYTGKLSSIFRRQTALMTDERVRIMDEIIAGIRVIKMFVWERPFTDLIKIARRSELNIVRKNSYVRGLHMTFLLFTTRMALFCTMLSIVLLHGNAQLTAARVFVITAYFNIVAHMMSQMFVRGVSEIAEALVAFRRLQDFMELEEIGVNNVERSAKGNPENPIVIRDLTASWKSYKKLDETLIIDDPVVAGAEAQRDATLNGLDITVGPGSLVIIVGPIGSGKSSLLLALLSELPLQNGSILVNGRISYASQEPWLFAGSARQNILFGQTFDRKRYDAVVEACALADDFAKWELGDETTVGERGTLLSGGQVARLNLARAVYCEADIYLLDDPLSSVDAHVGQQLLDDCLGRNGWLARQHGTRILVTNQVHFLAEADWVISMNEGKIVHQGHPKDLAKLDIDFADAVVDESDDHRNPPTSTLGRRSRIQSLMTNSVDYVSDAMNDNSSGKPHPLEASSKGRVDGSIFVKYLKCGARWYVLFGIGVLFSLTQVMASGADYWVSYWVSLEESRTITIPDQTRQESFLDTFEDLMSTEYCIYMHAALMAILSIIALSRSLTFYSVSVSASQRLHDNMFNGLISTSMRFFDTNPSGRILNRFFKDMGNTDEQLPKAILDAAQIVLNMLGAIVLTAVVDPWLIIPIVGLVVVFVGVRRLYVKTSKNLQRLDGITRSPVFTHLAATLSGLATIRVHNAQHVLSDEFDNHQDLHSGCWFMCIATTAAFGLCLDLICTLLTATVMFYFLLIVGADATTGDQVGLAITQVMSLAVTLQWGIRQSADVTNQLMSVERILEYGDLRPERRLAIGKPQPLLASRWPSCGRIEFRNVVYRYDVGGVAVLKNLSFVVRSAEKIGIVGRSGAGKTSLIGAIFRMAFIDDDGVISIDGVDTAEVGLDELRSRVSIIPQVPVLFSGTLRRNLDPFDEYADADVWRALANVELKDVATSTPEGLQMAVLSGGINFSVAQRQLICLARAILRDNRVLVLDEATANVDAHTDSLIQRTIREKFAKCTVLTVAHRLHTIMDSDRVLVMHNGEAVEFDEPHRLLQQTDGVFYRMINALGPMEMERLSRVARKKCK